MERELSCHAFREQRLFRDERRDTHARAAEARALEKRIGGVGRDPRALRNDEDASRILARARMASLVTVPRHAR